MTYTTHFPHVFRHITTLLGVAAVIACGSACSPAEDDVSSESEERNNEALNDGKTYSLWIHGLSLINPSKPATYEAFNPYWGPNDKEAGVNKIAVNWGGTGHVSTTNVSIRNALDCFCTGANFCNVAVHSAGNMQIGYALDLFGSTERNVTNAQPGADGTCQGTGETQVGWNIKVVDVAAGAAGGSELSDVGFWASPIARDLIADLRTTVARTLYDHNNTQGLTFNMYTGAKGLAGASLILPGEDDLAVAYHSSGGLSDVGAFCNAGDGDVSGCDDVLNLGDEGSLKQETLVFKWANHYVQFRDDKSAYNHIPNPSWGGVVSLVVEDMKRYFE
jgi:hypothetical protein